MNSEAHSSNPFVIHFPECLGDGDPQLVAGVMAIIAIGIITIFWKKGWFGNYATQSRSKYPLKKFRSQLHP